MLLVKFSAIESQHEITDSSQYVENICKAIEDAGMVTELVIDMSLSESGTARRIIQIDEEIFGYKYIYGSGANTTIIQIIFEFGTYETSNQITIEVSSDNYSFSLENPYLEQLKLKIKETIKNDWKRILWLYDKDSEYLSAKLYPVIYSTENYARQFISEIMSKEYGIQWWDRFITYDIKQKHTARLAGYKSIAPGFNNIDERLLSIYIGDLSKILDLKVKKWTPTFDALINDYLSEKLPINIDKLKRILYDQTSIDIDLWDSVFSKFLPKDFLEKFHTFELDRNHVAHNKLLDRCAYKQILLATQAVQRDLIEALKISEKLVVSKEQKEARERERLEEIAEMESTEKDIMESEADIQIRDTDQIIEVFEDALSIIHTGLTDDLRFRDDIEISSFQNLQTKVYTGTLFEIHYKIQNEVVSIDFDMILDDSQGATSSIQLIIKGIEDEVLVPVIEYIKGEAYFDEELGYYLPQTQDELLGVSEAQDFIIDYVNEQFANLREIVDANMYSVIKDGGNSPIANVPCCECGEMYICVDETYAPFDICINCGEYNEISVCERCGCYYEGAGDKDGLEPSLCPNCIAAIEDE